MLTDWKKMYAIIPRTERRQIWWVLAVSALSGLAQLTSIASVMPFMTVVAKPKFIFANPLLNDMYHYFGFTSVNNFLVYMGIAVLLLLAFSNAISVTVIWLLTRTINISGYLLSKNLLSSYLAQPYFFFLNRNTSELGKNILAEVNRVMNGVLGPALRIVSSSIVGIFILLMLIAVDPVLTAVVISVVAGSYLLIYMALRDRLAIVGASSSASNTARYRAASEALGGVKIIKLSGREADFIDKFSSPSQVFARYETQKSLFEKLPRYALETILFGGMLVIIVYLLSTNHYIQKTIPLTALYAYAGYRLMPVLQQIFAGLSSIRYHRASLNLLYADLNQTQDTSEEVHTDTTGPLSKIHLAADIRFENLCYTYPGNDREVIHGLSVIIKSNSTVGIVGETGSGKTTMIDLLLGLLYPDSGQILIDGIPLSDSNIRSWQRKVGYVPQDIYLSDDTIVRNIAFGIADKDINMKSVRQAAEIANIDRFINDELSNGYETNIGERGIRLSGGQRQRIGIARALYNDPDLIVLDEATSALDGVTENVVMDAIKNIYHKKTIIIVAHRLATVKGCDNILLLENGEISQSGNYEYMMANSGRFQELAKVSLL